MLLVGVHALACLGWRVWLAIVESHAFFVFKSTLKRELQQIPGQTRPRPPYPRAIGLAVCRFNRKRQFSLLVIFHFCSQPSARSMQASFDRAFADSQMF